MPLKRIQATIKASGATMSSTNESVTIDPISGDLIIHVSHTTYETEVIIERSAFAQIARGHARLIEETDVEVQEEERLEGYPVSRRTARQIPMETDDPATRAREALRRVVVPPREGS